jgi:hypothetical protein
MSTADAVIKILVYSDNAATREQVRLAIGRRPAADLPKVEFAEFAPQAAEIEQLDRGGIDVIVLDGEARPGGLGICRQAKDEIYDCPPVLAIIGRRDDGWLATWSRADAVVDQPLDPMAVANKVADLIRQRISTRLPVL